MTPDEHRAEAERLLRAVKEGSENVGANVIVQMAEVHARLAQTPQPVTVGLDPDAGLTDMLTAASVAGSGDGQAILAGRAMAREPEELCVCGHRETRHAFGGVYCLVGDPRCPCSGYEPVGSEPGERELEAGEYGYVSEPGGEE